jgi:tetratricopeptide (TPR) repeat protein
LAKEVLLAIDPSKLSVKNSALLVYTINFIVCLYELGEIERAEKIYESEMPILPAVTKVMALAVKILVAERFFFLGRYEESREHYQQALNEKLSKRRHLSILYRLAQIDEKSGDRLAAQQKYKKVADNGNKLWIATQAKKYLEHI